MLAFLRSKFFIAATLLLFVALAAPAEATYVQDSPTGGQPIPDGTTWTYYMQYVGPCGEDGECIELVIVGIDPVNNCLTYHSSWCVCDEQTDPPQVMTPAQVHAGIAGCPAGSPYVAPVQLHRPMGDPHAHVHNVGPVIVTNGPCP
jgi:hypothetical protein